MSSPVAVLISDIHFRLDTLDVASEALQQAVTAANELNVQLIIAGDLHDSKANIRGECIKRMMDILEKPIKRAIVLVGNHDRINEKATPHSLEFLRNTVKLIEKPYLLQSNTALIPYQHDMSELRAFLSTMPAKSLVIMHQGLINTDSGDYFNDPTALDSLDVQGLRVVSGHYHRRQSVKLPNGGVWDFIGNPFTLTYGESDHPEKGYQILHNTGELQFKPTNLRRHRIITLNEPPATGYGNQNTKANDLIWVKISASSNVLANLNKETLKKDLCISQNFKLDLIPTDVLSKVQHQPYITHEVMLDTIIDSISETTLERKMRLKQKWRELNKVA